MKKYQLVLIITFALVVTLWIVGRATNAFQYFSVPTKSNQPTYKTGSTFFASNLITPKRFDFICYVGTDPQVGKSIFFHRVCGMPGDTVEIRAGDLYINGVSQDSALNLKKFYSIPRGLAATLDFEDGEVTTLGNDSVIGPLETIQQKDIIKQAKRFMRDRNIEDPYIKNIYGQQWSADDFGPYVVPANTWFVLGDNRNMSQDSRYTGPVEKNRYIATVIR